MVYQYNNIMPLGGISKDSRQMLDSVNRQFSGPFEVSDIEKLFNLERSKVARLLAHWASKGWLTRIRRGLYITVPLGAKNPKTRSEDPWVIANKIFYPCYVGGWSACEHWGLTEQIFDSIVIFTSKKIRHSKSTIQSATFLLKSSKEKYFFGMKTVWRGSTKIQISDPSRTMVDILDDPSIGGGIRNVTDVLKEYFSGEHRDDKELIEYAKKLKNRTIYKRLGYFLEANKLEAPDLLRACKKNVSAGFSLLDPTVANKGSYLRRWNLRINVNLIDGMGNDKS